ncbi:hypothetical protein [Ottowia caeni]|uniref:hypothetical protein n=1 Tax=Ottowia caeni TaxID=2870339 RepID=UPI003D73F18A
MTENMPRHKVMRLGANEAVATQVARDYYRWWRNSAQGLNSVLSTAHFGCVGTPQFS